MTSPVENKPRYDLATRKSQSETASSLLKLDSLLLDSIAVAMFSTREVTDSSAHYSAVSGKCSGPRISQLAYIFYYFIRSTFLGKSTRI